MSERTVPQVECELCGVPFDPTETGGWCTNDDCGEWQYETYADYEPPAPDAASGSGSADESESDGAAGDAAAETGADAVESFGSASDGSESPGLPSDGSDSSESGSDATESSDPVSDDSTTESVADPIGDDAGTHETPVEKNTGPDVDLDVCPECGADADPSHRFCTGCGTDLDDIRASIAAVTTCPDCGADATEADRYCTSCGAELRTTDDADGSDGPPEDLSLEAYGRSIVVEPDQTVGREVRSLLADAGRPDDEAVRIHREHVRFVREDEEFYVVDIGENPTAVNGSRLEKGDRVAVEPGDELTLSEVVTLTIGSKNA